MPTNNKLTAAKRAKNDEFLPVTRTLKENWYIIMRNCAARASTVIATTCAQNFGNTLLKILMLSA